MNKVWLLALVWSAAFAHADTTALDAERYRAQTAEWRALRLGELTKPDGWLSLIGLHFLQPGANSVGKAEGNSIRLAQGPARFGVATVSPDLKVSFEVAAGVEATIDGRTAGSGDLLPGVGAVKPTVVACGTVSFFVIERGGKMALRVRDSASERRAQFVGIENFPLIRHGASRRAGWPSRNHARFRS